MKSGEISMAPLTTTPAEVVVGELVAFFANLPPIRILITRPRIHIDKLAVNHPPNEMQPLFGPMGLMAVQTGKYVIRVWGIDIRGREASFSKTHIGTIVRRVRPVSLRRPVYWLDSRAPSIRVI